MLPTTEILLRLFIACILGSAIGMERQHREWSAGLRTHMLVCMGATLIMLVSVHGFEDVVGKKGYSVDPSRIASLVVSGIGFLGAGSIVFLRQQVIKGLTTAAGLWTVAAIGLAVGSGMYIAAVGATAMALTILALIKPLEQRYFKFGKYNTIRVTINHGNTRLQQLELILDRANLPYNRIDLKTLDDLTDEISISLLKENLKKLNMLEILQQIKSIEGVQEAEFSLR